MVMLLLEVPTSHSRVPWLRSWLCLEFHYLVDAHAGRQQDTAHSSVPATHVRDPALHSGLLDLTWHTLGCYKHLKNEPVDDRNLCLSVLVFLFLYAF